MADQTSGDAAPQGMETKTVPAGFHSDPNVVRPAPVPFGDSTHIDRDAASDSGTASEKPAEGGGEQKATRKSSSSSGSKS